MENESLEQQPLEKLQGIVSRLQIRWTVDKKKSTKEEQMIWDRTLSEILRRRNERQRE